MASFRLNLANVRGLPSLAKTTAALDAFKIPTDGLFGVLSCKASGDSVRAELIHRLRQSVHKLDDAGENVVNTTIERITVYHLQLTPAKGRLEVYSGSANGIKRVEAFLTSHLSMPAVVEPVDVDVARAVENLSGRVKHFQLRSVRLEGYSPKTFMIGRYSPRFLDSQHGLEFLAENDEGVVAASVRFAVPNGRAAAILTRNACFSFSCNGDDRAFVEAALRRLV